MSRPTLDWQPWMDFQAYCRAYAVLNTSYPSIWSVYNDGTQGEIWMFPVPSQAGEIELDAICTPKDLNSDADAEAIPDAFHDAIKYGAASLAFMTSQRYSQAQVMENQFADRLWCGAGGGGRRQDAVDVWPEDLMIDHVASTVALARTLLMECDPVSVDTTLKTASLRLVLETFINLGGMHGSPLPTAKPSPSAQAVADGAARTVAGRIAAVDLEANPPGGEQRRGRL